MRTRGARTVPRWVAFAYYVVIVAYWFALLGVTGVMNTGFLF